MTTSKIDLTKLTRTKSGALIGRGLDDQSLWGQAKAYRKDVISHYKMLKNQDFGQLKSQLYWVSIKLDGHMKFLWIDETDCFLFDLNGQVIVDLPALDDAKSAFVLSGYQSVLLVGELYDDNHLVRPRANTIDGVLTNGDTQRLVFGAFDVLALDDQKFVPKNHEDKNQVIKALCCNPDSCLYHPIQQWLVDKKELMKRYNAWIEEGEEGVVCLSDDTHEVYKIKPTQTLDLVVVGYTVVPEHPESIRVLLVALMRPDGSLQLIGSVGVGFSIQERKDFFSRLHTTTVPSEYKATDGNKTLYTMVNPLVVVEVEYQEFVTDRNNQPRLKACLSFSDERGYMANRLEPFGDILGCNFTRIRDDKGVNPTDLRLTQLADFCELKNLECGARAANLSPGQVLVRQVFSRITKGVTSVRKFLVWETNKTYDMGYHKYVFIYINFSPNRKKPLVRVVRVSNDLDTINLILNDFKEKEIKRGWAEYL